MAATAQAPAPAVVGVPPARGDAPPPRPVRGRRLSFTALKTTMAVTGTVMAAFAAVHMVGNLKAFMGPEAYNSYAAWLRSVLYPLLPQKAVE